MKRILLLLPALIAVLVLSWNGCGPSEQRSQRMAVISKLEAPSKFDLVREYRQAFESKEAMEDFDLARPSRFIGNPNKAEIADGRLRIESYEADQKTTETNPRALVWLDKPFPHTIRIEYTVEALDTPQDLNLFLAADKGTTVPIGYEVVIGGQNNTKNGIYRWLAPKHWDPMNVYSYRYKMGGSIDMLPLRKGRPYDVMVERDGLKIRVYLDQTLIMEVDDEEALERQGEPPVQIAPILEDNSRFVGFSTWDNRIAIDNLDIEEIEPNELLRSGSP